jgi:chitinase
MRRVFFALLVLACSLPLAGQNRLLAYYWMGAKTQTPPYTAAQIPFRKLTHIAHSFLAIDPKADGGIVIDPGLLEPALISGAHAAGVKVLISIGGADASQAAFATVAKSEALRKAFARNVHQFVTANGYDGVDIDWEVPNAPADTQPCILLMQALRAELPAPGFLLSMAIPSNPPGWGTGFDVPSLAPILDFINVMTYDFHGPWSNHAGHNSPMLLSASDPGTEGSLTTSMDLFEKTYGVPRQKLNFGTAFYGYDFEGAKSLWDVCNCGKTTTSVNYGTSIKPRINHLGWKSYFDDSAKAPYLLFEGQGRGPGFVTYDDASSTAAKTSLVLGTRKMGGIFMWELSADYDGSSQDLLDAMYGAFLSARKPQFTSDGVTNGASFAHGISAGEIATIFGEGLGAGQGVVRARSVPLPTQLLSTMVTVGGIAAPLLAVANVNGAEQINFEVPWEIVGQGSVEVVVTSNGASSPAVQVPAHVGQPGVFTVDGVNVVAVGGANQKLVTAASPAKAGQIILLYATGLGPVTNQPRTGSPALSTALSSCTLPITVSIAGQRAHVIFSGLTPGYAGLYQINLSVPPILHPGVQDLIVTAGGVSSRAVKMAVR